MHTRYIQQGCVKRGWQYSVQQEYLGYVPSDAMVEKAVRQQKILSIYDPTSKAARSFEEIAKRLLDNESAALDEKRTISHVFSNFFNRKQ